MLNRIQPPVFLPIDPRELVLEPLALDPAAFQSPLPVQNHCLIYQDDEIGMAVGVWDTTTMQEAFGPYPGDEFITVLEGHFSILAADGSDVSGGAEQSACFRNAVPVSWKQEGYLKKIYLTLNAPDTPVPVIDSAAGGVRVFEPCRACAEPETQPESGVVARTELFRNDAGTMTVTECTYLDMRIPSAPSRSHRLVRLLRGEVVLSGDAGWVRTFRAGDHFFVPRNANCGWRIAAGTCAWQVDVTA